MLTCIRISTYKMYNGSIDVFEKMQLRTCINGNKLLRLWTFIIRKVGKINKFIAVAIYQNSVSWVANLSSWVAGFV